jgi:hypothetical protein
MRCDFCNCDVIPNGECASCLLYNAAGLAVLWLKESIGWEFEIAHARGWYRTENFPCSGPHTGYFRNEGTTGQFIPHMPGRHTRVWPIRGVGVLRFGMAA